MTTPNSGFAADIPHHRVKAAELSGGTSSEAIYRKIERLISDSGLRGSVLDYGAGTGELTRRLLGLERFSHIAAVDIMHVPSDIVGAVDWIKRDLNEAIPD